MSEKGKNTKDSKMDNRAAIREKWNTLESKSDIVSLVNVSLKDMYGEKAKQITLRKLNYYAYSKVNAKRYISFDIPKKDGSLRRIDAPCGGLRTIQRALNHVFQIVYTPHVAAMGFVPEKSVVTNARMHVGQRYVYNIDLKDFFPSITSGRVFKRLQSKPFGLKEDVARIITDLCCYENSEHRHVLPQGAPTSPTITNFICERLDLKLSRLAKAYGLKYTRYADDITFSGMNDLFDQDGRFCKSLRHIIEEKEHFTINQKKTRLCHTGMRQEVTGVTVNQNVSVSRKYVKQLRTLIHNWEVKGYDEAQAIFVSKYKSTKNHNFKGVHHIENIIAGKLLYMKMINGADDTTYTRLVERFERLLKDIAHDASAIKTEKSKGKDDVTTQNISDIQASTISAILDVWEKEGLDAAMELFTKNAENITGEKDVVNVERVPDDEVAIIDWGDDDIIAGFPKQEDFDGQIDKPKEKT